MKRKTVLAVCLCLSLFGCASKDPRVTPVPTPVPPVVTDQHMCDEACANLQLLGCEEGQPIDMYVPCSNDDECEEGQGCSSFTETCTVSCTKFCIDTENQGVWLDPGCVATITSCDQVESCPGPMPGAGKCDNVACLLTD